MQMQEGDQNKHDSQWLRWKPKDKRAIPSNLPREIIFTLEFCSHSNYQSCMKKGFSYFQTCKISKKKKLPSTNSLDSYLKCSSFALVKQTNKNEDPDQKWIEPRKALNGINSQSDCSSEGSQEVSLCKVWEYMKAGEWNKGKNGIRKYSEWGTTKILWKPM